MAIPLLVIWGMLSVVETADAHGDGNVERNLTAVFVHGQKLIVGTESNELLEMRGGRLQSVRTCGPEQAAGDAVSVILIDAAETIWAVSRHGVWWHAPGTGCWHHAVVDEQNYGVITQPVLAEGRLVIVVNDESVALSPASDRVSLTPVRHDRLEPEVAANTGIDLPNPDGLGLVRAGVRDSIRTATGTVIATDLGIWFLPLGVARSRIQQITAGDYDLLKLDRGRVMAAGQDGLAELRNGKIEAHHRLDIDSRIRDLATDDEGNVWFATDDGLRSLGAHFRPVSDPPQAGGAPVSSGKECLNGPQAERYGSGARERATTASGCQVRISGAIGATHGVLDTGQNSWILLDRSTYPNLNAIETDPVRPELLWVGTGDGLLLVDSSMRNRCVADLSRECVDQPCAGPATGCSVFTEEDGLPTNEITGLFVDDGRLYVETPEGTVEHHDAGVPPGERAPTILIDGRECGDCLQTDITWDAQRAVLSPGWPDLGDVSGIEHVVTLDGQPHASGGLDVVVPLGEGTVHNLVFEVVDRHFNWTDSQQYQLRVSSQPLLSRLSNPLIVGPSVLLLAVALWRIWKDWDLESVEVAHLRVTPDWEHRRLVCDVSIDANRRSLRRHRSWRAHIDLAEGSLTDRFGRYERELRAHHDQARGGSAVELDGPPRVHEAGADLASELAAIVDRDGRLTNLVRGQGPRTTRLNLVVVPSEWAEGSWWAHSLPWERLTAVDDPSSYLGDAGLVVSRLSAESPKSVKRIRSGPQRVLIAGVDQPSAAKASRPLNSLHTPEHYQRLFDAGPADVEIAAVRTSDEFVAKLLPDGELTEASASSQRAWDIARLHGHGAPRLIQFGNDRLAGRVDWSAVAATAPTLWMLMACNAGAPAIHSMTIEQGSINERSQPGLARALVRGEKPLGVYAIGFALEADLTSIAAFETLLFEQLASTRQLDVAVNNARRALVKHPDRFTLRLYANDPTLLLNERTLT